MKVSIINEKKSKEPKVFIKDIELQNKLLALVSAKNCEIMLLGIVEREENNFTITELLIPPMDNNSSAFVTTDDEKFPSFLLDLPREKRNKLRLHLHTHPNMAVTPSPTDENMINDMVSNISDFYIRIIANSDFKFKVDVFLTESNIKYEDVGLRFNINDLEIIFDRLGSPEIKPKIQKEFVEELDKNIKKQIETTKDKKTTNTKNTSTTDNTDTVSNLKLTNKFKQAVEKCLNIKLPDYNKNLIKLQKEQKELEKIKYPNTLGYIEREKSILYLETLVEDDQFAFYMDLIDIYDKLVIKIKKDRRVSKFTRMSGLFALNNDYKTIIDYLIKNEVIEEKYITTGYAINYLERNLDE